MNGSKWDMFLHSKIRGREYENIAGAIPVANNWISKNENFLRFLARRIERTRPDNPVSYLLAEDGDEIMLGAYGPVAAVLGEDHPQAWDRREGAIRGGRVKPFFLGYTARKGTAVPSAADLEGLTRTLKADLERLFEEAERICPVWTKSEHFVTNLASSPAMSDSVWDQAVRKLCSGKTLDGIVTFCDGKTEFVEQGEEVKKKAQNTLSSAENRALSRMTPTPAERGANPWQETTKWGGVILGIGMVSHGLCSLIAGIPLWENQKEKRNETENVSKSEKLWTKTVINSAEVIAGGALTLWSMRR